MSYWDEHERTRGHYTFGELDEQIDRIAQANGVISLCLGVRQPRWPENHWPAWALKLSEQERTRALNDFITVVVQRYKNYEHIISWQLENEALNRGFGTQGDFNRARMRNEYSLVKSLDPDRPIIMTTSDTYGIPLRQPRPDHFGFTLYQVQFEDNRYTNRALPIWWWPLRARIIRLLTKRDSFIHELQAEPWGPRAIWEMSIAEQNKSMSIMQLEKNIRLAKRTHLYPIDAWGGEWWYWRKLSGDKHLWQTVRQNLTSDTQ